MTDPTILAVIPARAGSKRLPGKNIKPLAGKPLIAWTIEAAQAVGPACKVWVSSDSPKILEVAETYGAAAPSLRPERLATDSARSVDVVLHAIEAYNELYGSLPELTLLLQPTSPLRSSDHILAALAKLKSNSADAVVSVCECEHSPLWSNKLPSNESLKDFLPPGLVNSRSQDLPTYYRLNGAIYGAHTTALLKAGSYFETEKPVAFIMPQSASVDIDTMVDFYFAETLVSIKGAEKE